MTLKIEFASDIKGFERVNKVLEENQKALNANADALARLNKEQGVLANGSMDFKGLDSIKNASAAVEKLAKSFDSVMSNQGGMRGFLTTFSGFRKEIGELNKEQGLTILDTMSKQMEGLKGSVTTSMDAVKRLRREMQEAEDSNAPQFVKDYKRSQYTAAAENASSNNELLNKLQIQTMMRRPILQGGFGPQLPGGVEGGFGGFMGGGTNLMRMLGAVGGIAAGAYGLNKASQWGLNAMYTENRAENAEYAQNRAIYENAQSGNIGRFYSRSKRIGKEGRLIKNIEEGDGSFFGTWMGDDPVESLLAKAHMGTTALIRGVLTGNRPNSTQMILERQNQMAELDSARNNSIDTIASRTKSVVTGNAFMGLEAGMDFGFARKLQSTLARNNLSIDEASPALFDARRYGVTDFAAVSGLAKSANETGVSDRARSEIFRQQSYNKPNSKKTGAYGALGSLLSVAGSSEIDMTNMSYREAISDVMAQRTMNIAGQVDIGSATAPFQNALSSMVNNGVQLSVPERISAANSIQNMIQGRMAQTGTMESMGSDFALMELGVKEAPVRAQISQLIAAGNTDAAVKYIANLTGKDQETIRNRLNLAKTQADTARKVIMFGSEENAQRVESAAKKAGLSATGAIMSGDANGVLGKAGMTETIQQSLPFAKDLSQYRSPVNLPEDTTGRRILGAEASQVDHYTKMTANLQTTATGEADKLVEVFTSFLQQYRNDIQEKLNDVQSEILKTKYPEVMRETPVQSLPQELKNPNGSVKGTYNRSALDKQ